MALQLHVADSATFKKEQALQPASPFYCAKGLIFNTRGRCTSGHRKYPPAVCSAPAACYNKLSYLHKTLGPRLLVGRLCLCERLRPETGLVACLGVQYAEDGGHKSLSDRHLP